MPGLLSSLGFARRAPAVRYADRVDIAGTKNIRAAAEALRGASDVELRHRFELCRDQLSVTTPPSEPSRRSDLFAVVDQAAQRTLNLRFHDVQFLGGQILAAGGIAEIQTGEGKTLVVALAAAALAAAGRRVHVMTANRYLAARDCKLLTPLYEFLGLRAALLPDLSNPGAKRAAYSSEIVYGTGDEFGFDYLREQLTLRQWHALPLGERLFHELQAENMTTTLALRPRPDCMIVDEADHVLLDEANSALLLSEAVNGPPPDAPAHLAAATVARQLQRDVHFVMGESPHDLRLTAAGLDQIHPPCVMLPSCQLLRPWTNYIEQALRAHWLLRRDVHYIVADSRIRIVHEPTGRILESHLWQDGLHQAVETKERVPLTSGTQTAARISRQRYFQQYRFHSGLTGTATGICEAEFLEFYKLAVHVVPRREPCRRSYLPSRFFVDQASKWNAIATDVATRHLRGQPVLIGTRTIDASERLVDLLQVRGVPCHVLNGKQDTAEADIIAQAGQLGAVTVATNMAGRGTDIRLGAGVAERGGLHVVLSEPHDSTRVDRQLLGRCARQDDPGSAQQYCAVDDALIARARPHWVDRARSLADLKGELRTDLTAEICQLQDLAERTAFHQRRLLLQSETARDLAVVQFHGARIFSNTA